MAGLLWSGLEALGLSESAEDERRRLLAERYDRGQSILGEAQQINPIPQGGVSPERFMTDEFQPAINTPQGQSQAYQGLLAAGYEDPQAKTAVGLLSPQSAQEPLSPKDMFSMTQDLSKQRTKELSNYVETRAQAQKTITSLLQGTGIGDLSAVISFNKSLDPTSVVRESEQKAVTGAAGPIERLNAMLKDIQGKGSLSNTSRQQMAQLIYEIQVNEAEYANYINEDYNQRAQQWGIDPASLRSGQLGYGSDGKPRTRFEASKIPTNLVPLPAGGEEY